MDNSEEENRNHRYRAPAHIVQHPGRTIHLAISILFILMFGVTAFAGIEAYRTSAVELKLLGPRVIDLTDESEPFVEPGFTASHCYLARCQDLTGDVVVESPHATEIANHVVGNYDISYRLNYGGESYTDIREIVIADTIPPELTLEGAESVGLYVGQPYYEPGFSAFDDHDGNIADSVTVNGTVDTSHLGVYTLTYTATDAAGNAAEKTRKVFVYNYSALTSEPIATFDDLTAYVQRSGLDVSFGFKNFAKDFEYTYQPDRVYYGASLVKTLDALYIYEQFGGPRSWNERFLLQNAISLSNNSAHKSLATSLGIPNLRNYADSIGMTLHLHGSNVDAFCDTSVADQLAEWSHLYELGESLSNGSELIQYFINGAYATMNFYGHPVMAFKAGFYGGTHHETAIFYDNSPYVFTVLTMNGYRPDREIRMRDLAERVYLLNQTL